MVVATLNNPQKSLDGFLQPGDFVKLRELSVRWSMPTQVSNMIRARSADVVFSGRNLADWSKYRGIDPENDFTATGGGDVPQDFQTIGLASYWTVRLNIGF